MPIPTPPSWFTRPLQLASPRMTGPDVKIAQAKAGMTGSAVDGVFSPKTVKEVTAYQKGRRIPANGVVDALTAWWMGEADV